MKKTTILLFTLISILNFSSCSKSNEDSKPDCELKKYGTVIISNSSNNPYNVYIDNVFKVQVPGKSISNKIELNEGNGRKLYAKQVSGYLLYPTEVDKSFNVVRCSDYSWQIP